MRALRPVLLVVAAVAVGAVLGLVLLGREEGLPPADAEGAAGPALRARTAVEPRVALFAEPVTAEAEFLVDPGRVDPGSLRLETRFDPFTLVSASRTESRAGDLARVRFRYRLSCSSAACAPDGSSSEVAIEPSQAIYVRRAAPGSGLPEVRTQDSVGWPAVEVASRLGPLDAEQARWRANVADLPELTRRASPAVLGAALLGGSLLLGLLGVALLATQLRPRRAPSAAVEEEARATPLERALDGVLASSSNGAGDDRRRSLERLARELSATGRGELASRARRLAWSPGPARPAEVDVLAADVRAVVEEER